MAEPINNRYDFVFFCDVKNGNPNGDPDAGNLPRIDPDTSRGIISDVCIKRKIRNYVDLIKGEAVDGPDVDEGELGYKIYVQEGVILNELHEMAYKYYQHADVRKNVERDMSRELEARLAKKLMKEKLLTGEEFREQLKKEMAEDKFKKDLKKAVDDCIQKVLVTKFMCDNFFDIRTFGAVMTTGKANKCGQVRGPVQLCFGESVDPVLPLEMSITRMARTNDDGKERGPFGRKQYVPYGLYRIEGFVSASLAEKSGFCQADLDLLWEAFMNMFENDRSAARGLMTSRKLVVFKHESKLGNAPAHKLFDAVQVEKNISTDQEPRKFEDYEIKVDEVGLPDGIEVKTYDYIAPSI
ncbi:type I-C CRISPR-associated protein Cas7/Csd2 [Atopobium sp. oral taxon 810]|uniref:type I-C CRISPR-associated protein Cas7/Csd2 n=1 Tax=Atopobium sp. oral taxon 810 TaxID=712158 RepID=UPI0003977884|nr:type I-C CRISPR-associated protein Cas7/Csd2 [Atopobium sp. oral taxon 810]ERI04265.1 hypothetical protein HMPREF9069_01563 [Atopobium sp. oral taxon 810 str. F0209]